MKVLKELKDVPQNTMSGLKQVATMPIKVVAAGGQMAAGTTMAGLQVVAAGGQMGLNTLAAGGQMGYNTLAAVPGTTMAGLQMVAAVPGNTANLIFRGAGSGENNRDNVPRVITFTQNGDNDPVNQRSINNDPATIVNDVEHQIRCMEEDDCVNLDIIKELIEDGEISPARLLHHAVNQRAKRTVRFLVEEYEVVNDTDEDGDTALHVAIRSYDVNILLILLKNGADPNRIDGQGLLPIVTAAHLPQGDECLVLLLQNGATVDATDHDGRTALFFVENPAASMQLMTRGARSDLADSNGVTPLHTALELWCRWRRGESLASILFHQAKLGRLLVSQASHIDTVDHFGRTPLHYACEVPHHPAPEFVQFLVQNWANVDARDQHGWTPLHVAIAFGNYESATVLIQMGARVDSSDVRGRTPIELIGLDTAASRQMPQETIAHAVHMLAFGKMAPRRFVAPLSDVSAAENGNIETTENKARQLQALYQMCFPRDVPEKAYDLQFAFATKEMMNVLML